MDYYYRLFFCETYCYALTTVLAAVDISPGCFLLERMYVQGSLTDLINQIMLFIETHLYLLTIVMCMHVKRHITYYAENFLDR